jgi:uncharacterized protein (TIGR03790 family)
MTTVAPAELLPTEVAIIAARGNAESQQLAEYYANARKIPASQICLVEMPVGDECPREVWDDSIRPAIAAWLAEHDAERKLRCLSTVWGVPMKIAAAAPSPALRAYQDYLAGERRSRLAALHVAIAEFEAIAPPGAVSTDAVGAAASAAAAAATPPPPAGSLEELPWLQGRLDAVLKAAQARVSALPQGATRKAAQDRLQRLVTAAGGATVILQNIQQQAARQLDPDPELVSELHRLRGATAAWVETRQLLEQRPPSIERDASILSIVERTGGLFGSISWLDEQMAAAAKNESAASFDSELALVLWPAGYEVLGRQPNYLRRIYDQSHLRAAFPTLMVARIDAPTPELARGLVDAALDAEQDGLIGTAYFDSRGIAERADAADRQQGEAAAYDRALLAAAEGFERGTTVPVVVNRGPELFAAGECPDAALYCGWYSLGRYVDAFTFNRGAVAFHAGGDEADSLHDAASQRWCKRLLEDGAAATLGATFGDDPTAFPRPNEFWGLLAGSDLTLAECAWRTQPFTSWSLAVIGDPLYRPFKNRRIAKEESVIRDAGR